MVSFQNDKDLNTQNLSIKNNKKPPNNREPKKIGGIEYEEGHILVSAKPLSYWLFSFFIIISCIVATIITMSAIYSKEAKKIAVSNSISIKEIKEIVASVVKTSKETSVATSKSMRRVDEYLKEAKKTVTAGKIKDLFYKDSKKKVA